MICAYLAFTDTGLALAKRLAADLPAAAMKPGRCTLPIGRPASLPGAMPLFL